jgi:hypothetical protein
MHIFEGNMKRHVHQSVAPALAMATVLALSSPALAADDVLTTSSEQAVSLFSRSCMTFAGQKDQLRAWTQAQKIPEMPQDKATILMGKFPGKAFAISTPVGNYIIGSQDDGGCTLFVQRADGKILATQLEAIIAASKLTLKITSDQNDANNRDMHHRGYEIAGKNRKWLVALSFMPPGKTALDAILTAYNVNMPSP